MKTCSTCQHWRPFTEDRQRTDFGSCQSDKFLYDDGCNRDKDFATDMLLYSDYEGYSACFDTGKDFGCIHHEEETQ